MKKKRRKKKTISPKQIIGSVIVGLVIAGLIILLGGGKEKKPKVDPSAPMKDQLATIFELTGIEAENVKVVPSTEGGHDVTFDFKYSVLNETDFISKSIGAYAKYCDLVYKETDISGINFYIYGEMMDQKGNTNNEKMFVMSMPKETFQTYNWENMENKLVVFDLIEGDCKELYIAPGVRNRAELKAVSVRFP